MYVCKCTYRHMIDICTYQYTLGFYISIYNYIDAGKTLFLAKTPLCLKRWAAGCSRAYGLGNLGWRFRFT